MSSPVLLPCPFCGKSEFVRLRDYQGECDNCGLGAWGRIVICDAAGAHLLGTPNPRGCGASIGFCETDAEAIAEWNRRASGKTECRVVGAVPADVEGLRRHANEVEDAVAQGHYDAEQTYTQMRQLLDRALRGRVVGGQDVAGLRERLAAVEKSPLRHIPAPSETTLWGIARDAIALLERAAPPRDEKPLGVGPSTQQPGAGAEVVDLLTGERYVLEEKDGVTVGRAQGQHDAEPPK